MDNSVLDVIAVALVILLFEAWSIGKKIERCANLLAECANSLDSLDGKVNDSADD